MVDRSPPTVTLVASLADTGDGQLDEGEATNVAVTELHVTFDEAMDAILAESTTSYLLIEAGTDQTIDTIDCAGGSRATTWRSRSTARATATRRAPWK
ncbi:MAG: hypothetical protein R2862_03015 [Thermoanaerobaculia bacterium]